MKNINIKFKMLQRDIKMAGEGIEINEFLNKFKDYTIKELEAFSNIYYWLLIIYEGKLYLDNKEVEGKRIPFKLLMQQK